MRSAYYCHLFFLPSSTRVTQIDHTDIWTHCELHWRTGNCLRNTNLFNGLYMHDFSPKGGNIFLTLDSKYAWLFLWRETLSLSSKDVHYVNIFKNLVCNKVQLILCFIRWMEMHETHGQRSSNNYIFKYSPIREYNSWKKWAKCFHVKSG